MDQCHMLAEDRLRPVERTWCHRVSNGPRPPPKGPTTIKLSSKTGPKWAQNKMGSCDGLPGLQSVMASQACNLMGKL